MQSSSQRAGNIFTLARLPHRFNTARPSAGEAGARFSRVASGGLIRERRWCAVPTGWFVRRFKSTRRLPIRYATEPRAQYSRKLPLGHKPLVWGSIGGRFETLETDTDLTIL